MHGQITLTKQNLENVALIPVRPASSNNAYPQWKLAPHSATLRLQPILPKNISHIEKKFLSLNERDLAQDPRIQVEYLQVLEKLNIDQLYQLKKGLQKDYESEYNKQLEIGKSAAQEWRNRFASFSMRNVCWQIAQLEYGKNSATSSAQTPEPIAKRPRTSEFESDHIMGVGQIDFEVPANLSRDQLELFTKQVINQTLPKILSNPFNPHLGKSSQEITDSIIRAFNSFRANFTTEISDSQQSNFYNTHLTLIKELPHPPTEAINYLETQINSLPSHNPYLDIANTPEILIKKLQVAVGNFDIASIAQSPNLEALKKISSLYEDHLKKAAISPHQKELERVKEYISYQLALVNSILGIESRLDEIGFHHGTSSLASCIEAQKKFCNEELQNLLTQSNSFPTTTTSPNTALDFSAYLTTRIEYLQTSYLHASLTALEVVHTIDTTLIEIEKNGSQFLLSSSEITDQQLQYCHDEANRVSPVIATHRYYTSRIVDYLAQVIPKLR